MITGYIPSAHCGDSYLILRPLLRPLGSVIYIPVPAVCTFIHCIGEIQSRPRRRILFQIVVLLYYLHIEAGRCQLLHCLCYELCQHVHAQRHIRRTEYCHLLGSSIYLLYLLLRISRRADDERRACLPAVLQQACKSCRCGEIDDRIRFHIALTEVIKHWVFILHPFILVYSCDYLGVFSFTGDPGHGLSHVAVTAAYYYP